MTKFVFAECLCEEERFHYVFYNEATEEKTSSLLSKNQARYVLADMGKAGLLDSANMNELRRSIERSALPENIPLNEKEIRAFAQACIDSDEPIEIIDTAIRQTFHTTGIDDVHRETILDLVRASIHPEPYSDTEINLCAWSLILITSKEKWEAKVATATKDKVHSEEDGIKILERAKNPTPVSESDLDVLAGHLAPTPPTVRAEIYKNLQDLNLISDEMIKKLEERIQITASILGEFRGQ